MKILCFSPNDAVWRWTLPQAQFLEALQQRGDTIEYLHCDRILSSYCTSMASLGVQPGATADVKAAVCDRCTSNSKLVRDRFGFSGHALPAYLTDAERLEARHLAKLLSIGEMVAYEIDNVTVGKFALYEMIIQTKSLTLDLTPAAEKLYRITFENGLLTAFATRRALDQHRPDVGITYHTAYCVNRVFQHLTEARDTPVWFLNASFNMAEMDTHLVAARSDPERLFRKMLTDWEQFRELPVSPKSIVAATDHLNALIEGGGFAYSTAMKKRDGGFLKHIGCASGKKIFSALLSSYDELLAAEYAGFGWTASNTVFKNQIDWVRALYAYAEEHEGVHIIIRAHPREFPFGGNAQRSEHSVMLAEVFARHPGNVSINLPTDGISIYELLAETDVALVAWSSAGMEAGMLGIPVVTWIGDALLFPRELTFEATSREAYNATIERALASGWSLERAGLFYRWVVLMLVRTRIDLTNGHAPSVRSGRIMRFLRRAVGVLRRRLTPWTDQIWSIERRKRLLDARLDIYALIDRKYATFYDIESAAPRPAASKADESKALVGQLWSIARVVRRKTGTRSERLETMLSTQAKRFG